MKRIGLLHKMDGLLESCKGCTKRSDPAPPDVRCQGCNTYPKLREIGNQLGRKDKMAKFDMQVAEYVKLNAKMSKREMAKHLDISEGTLYAWINHNKEEINTTVSAQEPVTAIKKPSEGKTTTEDKTAEYEREIAVLKSDLNNLINDNKGLGELIDDLQAKVKEYENINAACEDVESEITTLREENDQWKKTRLHMDYVMENQKYQLGQFAKENEELAEENKALKVFARRYLRME